MRVSDDLENVGVDPLSYLDLSAPAGSSFGVTNITLRVNGREVEIAHVNGEPGAPVRVRFTDLWKPKEHRAIVTEYDLDPKLAGDGAVGAAADGFYITDPAAFPAWRPPFGVFVKADLRAHVARFPAGQLVAVVDGALVGGIASLILPRSIDALAPHTWIGVTDRGTFERHDPAGETLYLADVYVAARAWGHGVGRALYAELFALCRRLGASRVVGGGRLYSYVDAPAELTAEAYIAGVVRGERRDRVLESQLRAGFQVRGVLREYLHDWRSRHCASLIVWDNPDRETTALAVRPHEAEPGTGNRNREV